MSLVETFRDHSNILTSKSPALRVVHHPGDRGGEHEDVLEEFLSPLLPERLGIGRGEIRATNGVWSKQEDLIIYDRLNCPRLFAGRRTQVFPAESVAAVIEVKTRLGKKEIIRATENKEARSLKKVGMGTKVGVVYGKQTPILGVLFAFDLSLSLKTLRQRWNDAQSSLLPEHRINLACILGTMTIVHLDDTFHLWDRASEPMLGSFLPVDSKEDTLLLFTVLLMRALLETRFGIPDLFKYYLGDAQLSFPFVYKE